MGANAEGRMMNAEATPMRHQCDIKATPKRVDSQPIGMSAVAGMWMKTTGLKIHSA
jgi:hypothetical protein